MSNCYTEFSAGLKISNTVQEDYLTKLLRDEVAVLTSGTVVEEHDEILQQQEYQLVPRFIGIGVEKKLIDPAEEFLDIGFVADFVGLLVRRDRLLSIYNDESGEPKHVGLLVQFFMQEMQIDGVWHMSFAHTGSKGPFGGGCLLVTQKRLELFDVGEKIASWLDDPAVQDKLNLAVE